MYPRHTNSRQTTPAITHAHTLSTHIAMPKGQPHHTQYTTIRARFLNKPIRHVLNHAVGAPNSILWSDTPTVREGKNEQQGRRGSMLCGLVVVEEMYKREQRTHLYKPHTRP